MLASLIPLLTGVSLALAPPSSDAAAGSEAAAVHLMATAGVALQVERAAGEARQDGAGAEQQAHALKEGELKRARAAIERAAKATEKVPFVEADFRQLQESLLLEEPLVSHGRLQLRTQEPCILLRFTKPKEIVVRSDAHAHLVYHPGKKRAERYVFRSNEVAKAIVSMFSADIRDTEKQFRFTGLREVEKAVELTMKPRDERVAKLLPELSIRFRAEDGVPDRIAYRNRDGERVTLELSELRLVRKEKELSRSFGLKLPDDVELVVHEVRVENEADESPGERGDGGQAP